MFVCIVDLEFGAWVAACRPDPARSIGQREGLCRLPLSASRQKGVVGGKEERAAFSSPASPLAPPHGGHMLPSGGHSVSTYAFSTTSRRRPDSRCVLVDL